MLIRLSFNFAGVDIVIYDGTGRAVELADDAPPLHHLVFLCQLPLITLVSYHPLPTINHTRTVLELADDAPPFPHTLPPRLAPVVRS